MDRRFRLRRSADFERLRRSGRRWHHPLMSLVLGANELQFNRFGVVASREVGKATKRNRAKRLLREALRLRAPTLPQGYDYLLIARPGIDIASFQEVRQALDDLLYKATKNRQDQ